MINTTIIVAKYRNINISASVPNKSRPGLVLGHSCARAVFVPQSSGSSMRFKGSTGAANYRWLIMP